MIRYCKWFSRILKIYLLQEPSTSHSKMGGIGSGVPFLPKHSKWIINQSIRYQNRSRQGLSARSCAPSSFKPKYLASLIADAPMHRLSLEKVVFADFLTYNFTF